MQVMRKDTYTRCTDWGYETSSRKWEKSATGCPSWCRPLCPLFHFLDDVSYPQSVGTYRDTGPLKAQKLVYLESVRF